MGVLYRVFSTADAAGNICRTVCMCVYMQTHTHTTHGECDVSPGDETPGGPEESTGRWTTSQHICICMCTKYGWNCTTSYKFSVSVKKMGEG